MPLLSRRIGNSVDRRPSIEVLLSKDGLVSVDGRPPELLIGLEKLKDGRWRGVPFTEHSEVILGERWTGRMYGEYGDCGLEVPLLPENLRGACVNLFVPFTEEPSSSPLSCGTDRMLATLRGVLAKPGDLGGASPNGSLWEMVESLVIVRGYDDVIESMLLVRLGTLGEGASTVTFVGSTGSGEEALGTPIPK